MTLHPIDDPISTREIAQHLRRMMDLAGISTPLLSQRLGVNERTIQLWLDGRNLVKTATVLAAFEALGCRVVISPPRRYARQVRLR